MKVLVIAALCAAFSPLTFANEIECLAKNIYFEARDQKEEGRLAVAMVTMNRVKSRQFPSTVCEVVYQRNQFSWFWDGAPDNPEEEQSYKHALALARVVYDYHHCLEDNTHGSLYYKRHDVDHRFFNKLTLVKRIDAHEFYR